MENLILQFENEAQNYLNNINKDNFFNSYDGFISIIIKYKNMGITKEQTIEILHKIDSVDLDEYKEDVLLEMSNRIHGFCTSTRAIKW